MITTTESSKFTRRDTLILFIAASVAMVPSVLPQAKPETPKTNAAATAPFQLAL